MALQPARSIVLIQFWRYFSSDIAAAAAVITAAAPPSPRTHISSDRPAGALHNKQHPEDPKLIIQSNYSDMARNAIYIYINGDVCV